MSPEFELPKINVPSRRAEGVSVPSNSEGSGETLAAIKKRLEEVKKENEELKMEVEDAETRAENETQKYANEIALLLKQNNELRKRKQKAENEFILAKEARSKARSEMLEEQPKDVNMQDPDVPKSNDLDAVLEQEMKDRQARENEQETQE